MIRFIKLAVVAGLAGYLCLKVFGRTCPECHSILTHELAQVPPSPVRSLECFWCDHIWFVEL